MKILYSGYHNPCFITITEYIEEAICNLGHQLIVFDDRNHIIPGRIRHRISWLHHLDIQYINKTFNKLVAKTNPNVAVITGGYRIMAKTVQCLKDNGIQTALWTIDVPKNFEPILKIAPYYDFVFCGGSEAQELFNANGINNSIWLPFACDPSYHHAVDLTEEERAAYMKDIAFVGSFYPCRWRILKQITDFDMGIWGPGWQMAGTTSCCNTVINNGMLGYSEWIRIFSAAKVVIVIHYQDGNTPCYQASPKIYEALACKSFVLVDRQQDVFRLFEDGTHLVGFDGIEDLREKINFYLRHPGEREKIARQGYREVMEKHTYKHRIKKMLSALKA